MTTTTVTLSIQNPETSSSWQIELADDFETVFSKVYPLQPPSSSLEHRANMRHTTVDGRVITIQPMTIAVVEETAP